MESPMTLAEMEGLVADPATSAEKLRLIAYFAPSLRAAVVDHPNTYPGLLDWLEEVGGPEVAARVAERRAADSRGPVEEPAAQEALEGAPAEDVPLGDDASQPDARADDAPEESEEAAESAPEESEEDAEGAPEDDGPEPFAGEGTEAFGEAAGADAADAPHEEDRPDETPDPRDPHGGDQATMLLPAQKGPEEEGVRVDRRSIFPALAPSAFPDDASQPGAPADDAPWEVSQGEGSSSRAEPAPLPTAYAPSGGEPPAPEHDSSSRAEAPAPEAEPRDKRLRWILIVLIVALLAILGWLVFGQSDPVGGIPASGTQSDSDAAAQSLQPAAPAPALGEDSPQSDQPQSAILFPVRPDARTMPGFSAPSGNIVCFLGDDEASCKIAETSWEGTSFQTCAGDEGVGVLSLEGSRAGASCAALDLGQAPVLDYGEYAKNGKVACVSTQDGISCWHQVTGKAFALARGGWRIAEGGEIGPDAYTW